MLMKRNRLTLLAAAVAIAAVGVGLFWSSEARADDPATIQIAIPVNVTINVGSHTVVFIGRPTSTSPVACAPENTVYVAYTLAAKGAKKDEAT